jgi:hypothetical protein
MEISNPCAKKVVYSYFVKSFSLSRFGSYVSVEFHI